MALKPWIENPPEGFTGVTSFPKGSDPAGVNLKSAGDYPLTVPTKEPGVGPQPPMSKVSPDKRKAGTLTANTTFVDGGRRGTDEASEAALKNVKRTIVP